MADTANQTMSEEEWRRKLTPEQFRVLREHGTEHAGTSALNREKRPGRFTCAGCGAEHHPDERFCPNCGKPVAAG